MATDVILDSVPFCFSNQSLFIKGLIKVIQPHQLCQVLLLLFCCQFFFSSHCRPPPFLWYYLPFMCMSCMDIVSAFRYLDSHTDIMAVVDLDGGAKIWGGESFLQHYHSWIFWDGRARRKNTGSAYHHNRCRQNTVMLFVVVVW